MLISMLKRPVKKNKHFISSKKSGFKPSYETVKSDVDSIGADQNKVGGHV